MTGQGMTGQGTAAAEAAGVPRLRLTGVKKSFGDKAKRKVVLDGIDLSVPAHGVCCLIGPSGCGKSTLLRCVNLLDPVDDGLIELDGERISGKGVNANTVRRRVGIVFQAYNLFPHLTVLDNITLAPRRVRGVGRREAEERAREALDRFGLGDKVDEYPDRLSGGQQQRAAIARAIVGEPELLLLDEVTSALDPELVGEVLSVIRDLAAGGMTMVLATHEMGFARDVADQVAFLHEGRVLESGPPAQILSEPTQPRTRQFLARVIAAGRL
jgi:polar amino acid transport system ATP-binding protein